MTWKDKLEIGLKEDAPYRKDNLPTSEIQGPQLSKGPGRSAEVVLARTDETAQPGTPGTSVARRSGRGRSGSARRKGH